MFVCDTVVYMLKYPKKKGYWNSCKSLSLSVGIKISIWDHAKELVLKSFPKLKEIGGYNYLINKIDMHQMG